MTYYKVRSQYDNMQVTKQDKRGRLKINRYLVANELYTPAEVKRYFDGATFRGHGMIGEKRYIFSVLFEEIEARPKDTYFFFGARFTD